MEFRRSLAASFLFRFFADTAAALEADAREDGGGYLAASAGLPEGHASAAVRFERPPSRGVQIHGKPGEAAIVGAPCAPPGGRPAGAQRVFDELGNHCAP